MRARHNKRRVKLGVTRTSLAEEAGCSPQMITVIEKGHIPQKSAALPRILEALARLEQR